MHPLSAAMVLAALVVPSPPAGGAPAATDQLVAIIAGFTGRASTDWDGLDALPGIKWAALGPTALKNCLPDGGCFARQGSATLDGRSITVMATGARTIVSNLYLRNAGAAFGEPAVLAALKQAGFTATLARCPVQGGTGSTNWYRLKGTGEPAVLAVQAARGAKPNEGFVISSGDELPQLQPNQLALYSEDCTPGAAQKPVSTVKPHVALADVVTGLLVPATSPGLDWKGLTAIDNGITWDAAGPKKWDLTFKNDPSPMAVSGSATYAGRKFSALASGTATQVKSIYLEELGMHPRGEHMLGVVYERGVTVKLVRCGPVYTESTNNWYSLTSAKTRPAMIQQSIGYEGNQTQDAYALRLDGTLPAKDARDREPGVAGCK